MYKKCSKSLASHAADVFKTMTGHIPTKIEISANDQPGTQMHYTIGVRVNFQGVEIAQGQAVKGFFICAFETLDLAFSFAGDISKYLGLTAINSVSEIDNYVGEFLNVVIGLTCSTWAEHGLIVEFYPPEQLKEHTIEINPSSGHFFQVAIFAENFYKTTLFVHFFPQKS
jgi:hypothetical protein